MKFEKKFPSSINLVVVVCLGLALTAHSAATNTTKKAEAAAKSETTEIVNTKSVFEIPKARPEGKDPFFPNSDRVYKEFQPAPTTKTNAPVVVAIDLVLSGISGSAEQPLAIINDRTFAPGESREVISGGQSRVIRCLEINMQAKTALVEIGGERRELRLKPR